MATATAIVKSEPQQQSSSLQPFNPGTFAEAMEMSKFLATSNLIPSSIRGKPADVMLIMMKGRELGLSVMQSLGEIYVVEGRPSASAKLKVALCLQRTDLCEYFTMAESTDRKATFKTKRKGHPEVVLSYTIEQAQTAGLAGKNNWKYHPAAMLRARCESALADAVFPDLVGGLLTPDEAEEVREDVERQRYTAPPPSGGPATMTVNPPPVADAAAKKAAPTDAELVENTPPPSPASQTAPAPASTVPTPVPEADPFADEPPPPPPPPAPSDTPESEADAIRTAIKSAKSDADLKALVGRIKKLPPDLQYTLKGPYADRQKELRAHAS